MMGELEVALVVSGDAHDGAGAVPEESVIGDPDGDVLAGEVVLAVGAGEYAGLLALRGEALNLGLAAGLIHVGVHLGAAIGGGDEGDERVLRRQHHEGDAEDGVRAGGEDTQLLLVDAGNVEAEGDLHALGAADPVALHGGYALRPFDAGEVEELVGVVGDAEEPLLQVALRDGGMAALAGAIGEDLLVGEDGLTGGAPVGGGEGAVGEPFFEELKEEPLVPAVVFGVGAYGLAGPVEHGAHCLELAPHIVDVVVGPLMGVDALADGSVLGGEAEGVEADGEEDVEATHAAVSGGGIGGGHGVPVADVDIAGGVGEHGEEVELLAIVVGGLVKAVGLPLCLPLFLNFGGIVALSHRVLSRVRCHPYCWR